MTTSPFLALHAIHTVPASLLNRDANGAAKQITVDGTPRVRVSSQAWKRAMRIHHRDTFLAEGGAALRTRRLPSLIADALTTAHNIDADKARILAFKAIDKMGIKVKDDTGDTAVLTFTRESAPREMAEILAPVADTIDVNAIDTDLVASLRTVFAVGDCIDLALYGRMLTTKASNWDTNIDGALQVAHPFSTHPAAIDMDFFTAVDDAAPDGGAASGYLESVDLTAPTLYRYAVVDRRQLSANFAHSATHHDTLTGRAIAAVIDDFVTAMPQTKVRSTAATTLPSVVIAVSGKAVYSAANAFSPAVLGRTITEDSISRLIAQITRTTTVTGGSVVALPLDTAADTALSGSDVRCVDSIDALIQEIQ